MTSDFSKKETVNSLLDHSLFVKRIASINISDFSCLYHGFSDSPEPSLAQAMKKALLHSRRQHTWQKGTLEVGRTGLQL